MDHLEHWRWWVRVLPSKVLLRQQVACLCCFGGMAAKGVPGCAFPDAPLSPFHFVNLPPSLWGGLLQAAPHQGQTAQWEEELLLPSPHL